MSRYEDVEKGHWVQLDEMLDYERLAHLNRIEETKAATRRREASNAKAAEAERLIRSNDEAAYASGQREADKFLAKSPRHYDVEPGKIYGVEPS